MRMGVFLMSCIFAVQVLCAEGNTFTLNVPQEKQKVIVELISVMGSSSTLALGFKKTHLEGLGKELRGIDPLQFLAYVFSEPSLHKHMRTIKGSSFKWGGFMKGFAPRLKQEAAKEEFLKDVAAFATFLSVPYDRLEKAAKEQNWDEFVGTLIDHKK